MSGGSFNYLCFAEPATLFEKREDLRQMAAKLTELSYKDAALETESVLAYIEHADRQIQARIVRLRYLWKTVEWYCSADYGLPQVEEAIQRYRGA